MATYYYYIIIFGNLHFDFYIRSPFSFVTESGVLLESGILIFMESGILNFMESGFLFYIHPN